MNWFSLIPAALGALGGIFGGGNTTSTTTNSPQLSPALSAAANTALTKANTILAKPYPTYTGERVAGPTAARSALDPIMSQMGQVVSGNLSNNGANQARISQLMSRGPMQVQAPNLVPSGGPSVSYNPGV